MKCSLLPAACCLLPAACCCLLLLAAACCCGPGSLIPDHELTESRWCGTDRGEYWGEAGYVNVKFGSLALQQGCAWAVPGSFTAPEEHNQVHCFEDGSNCKA